MSTILSIRVKNICFSMSTNKIWSESSLLFCYSDESKEPLVTVIQPEVRSTTVKKLGLFSVIGISIVFTQVWYILSLSVFEISNSLTVWPIRKNLKSSRITCRSPIRCIYTLMYNNVILKYIFTENFLKSRS